MNDKNVILDRVIAKYGAEHQLTVATEELSELIKELCKWKRYGNNREAIIEELADVGLMLWQIKKIVGIEAWEIVTAQDKKIDRLLQRMEEDENEICVEKQIQ